ncbi:MAG: tRNA (cytidine(34)-2'-O)-methyltransferase [Proteobacteria bacterium]|nr:tRNA (cytidine(34)-2'-O)-methyltransferase [Pseudomonadota bacterium]
MAIQIALYQPDMPQNVGSIIRTSVAFGYKVHIIMPTGFIFSSQKLQRAGMDYINRADIIKHKSFTDFQNSKSVKNANRIVLLTTKGAKPIQDFEFQDGDLLLFGRESAGVPDDVHNFANERVFIPMVQGERSINLAQSVAISAFAAMSGLGIRADKI